MLGEVFVHFERTDLALARAIPMLPPSAGPTDPTQE